MKFSRFLQPGSVELLNLRIKLKADGCPHCQCPCAMVSHGYLQAISKENTKGLRLFCSNRYSNQGCGRTIQVYWNTVIPGFMWQTSMILALVRVVASGPSIHGGLVLFGTEDFAEFRLSVDEQVGQAHRPYPGRTLSGGSATGQGRLSA